MILYHGTSTKHYESIKTEGFRIGAWLAKKDWHGLQLAKRTAKRDGGIPIVLSIEIEPKNRIVGREKPSYRYVGENYNLLSVAKMVYTPII